MPTMSELAAELGLSRMTVSSVINGRAKQLGFAQATIKRVSEHINSRGYVPSRYARGIRSQERVVGILHMGKLYTHLNELFNRLSEALAPTASALEIMVAPEKRLDTCVRELLARRVTDLVWLHNNSAYEPYREEWIAHYLDNTRTVICGFLFDSQQGEADLLKRGFCLVGINRLKHRRCLADFLFRLGHRIIALPDVSTSTQNQARYFESFIGAGLEVAPFPLPFRAKALINVMRTRRVTAACFHSDSTACLAIRDLKLAGVHIPEDLTVTGFDGMSTPFYPDLTTLVMPVYEMVEQVRTIIEGNCKGERHCLDMKLHKGFTHGPPGKGKVNGK